MLLLQFIFFLGAIKGADRLEHFLGKYLGLKEIAGIASDIRKGAITLL